MGQKTWAAAGKGFLIMMKLIHITDTHFVPRGKTLFGGDPLKNLERCVADINLHHADAEVCVLTGDLTHWAEPEAYEALRECLDPLITPLRVIIGNHDVRNEMFRWFPEQPLDENGFYQSAEDFSAGRFLFLDTHEPGKHEGHYCEKRLDWLERQLADSGKSSLFLFMHHPPFDIRHPTLDRIGLVAKEAFTRTVRPHCGRIRHLFFGHIHRPLSGHWLGISMSSLRGINHQVWLDFEETENLPYSFEPPAYSVVLIGKEELIVHTHDFMDKSPKFNPHTCKVRDWAYRKQSGSAEIC